MPRRLSLIALFAAWFCASGAMLDIVQVFAWAKMFAGYAQTESVGQAAVEAMDPGKPCQLCLAVRRAREESNRDASASLPAAAEKLVLAFQEEVPAVFSRETIAWTDAVIRTPSSWARPVPVPPPRDGSANVIG